MGSWPTKENSVNLLTKILKANGINPKHPDEIKVDKIKTDAEPVTGSILRQTIKFILTKEDFESIKAWMNKNDKNHFEFFQKMPFYLMAPNGKIVKWSPKS